MLACTYGTGKQGSAAVLVLATLEAGGARGGGIELEVGGNPKASPKGEEAPARTIGIVATYNEQNH